MIVSSVKFVEIGSNLNNFIQNSELMYKVFEYERNKLN